MLALLEAAIVRMPSQRTGSYNVRECQVKGQGLTIASKSQVPRQGLTMLNEKKMEWGAA
jgi:hypothetical protein